MGSAQQHAAIHRPLAALSRRAASAMPATAISQGTRNPARELLSAKVAHGRRLSSRLSNRELLAEPGSMASPGVRSVPSLSA